MVKNTNINAEKELISKAKSGDEAAFSELAEMYEPLIGAMSEKYHRIIADTESDDLRQEARVALYRALISYDSGQTKVTFGLYAKICIRNRMVSICRKLGAERRRSAMREAVPARPAKAELSPIGDELKALSEVLLSGLEKKVFLMYLDGRSYADISSEVGKSLKSVDNALCRAKRKVRIGYKDSRSI